MRDRKTGGAGAERALLQVDTDRSRLVMGDRVVPLRGRWDTAVLWCLSAGGHHGARTAASVDVLQAALHDFGLDRPLAPVQWGRIVDRLRAALRQIDSARALDLRLCHAVRGKTAGPWWWQPDPLLELDCRVPATMVLGLPGPARAAHSPARQTSLALRQDGFDTLRLTNRFKGAMEAMWKAHPTHAAQLLADGDGWAGESPALQALRKLRHAELLSGLGDFTGAAARLVEVRQIAAASGLSALLSPQADVAGWRLAYASDPVGQHAAVAEDLRRALQAHGCGPQPTLDTTAWAEHCHLLALCERRVLEASLPQHPAADARSAALLAPLLASAHAALYLFLVVRNYERAQHVCANLAYAHQKLALWLKGPHWAMAVEWHALSFSLHTTFGGAEGSAWEYIYLGELWLSAREARQAWQKVRARAVWEDETPDRLSFYDKACRVALQLRDPRQLAHALLNRYRFALSARAIGVREDSLQRLAALLAERPELTALLQSEGYVLPRFERLRGLDGVRIVKRASR